MRSGLLAGVAVLGACAAQPVTFRVNFSMSETRRAPLTVAFRAQASADHRVVWDFGDGQGGQGSATAHTYYQPGTYTVRAQLLDNRGRVRSTATGDVKVESSGPERAELVVLLGRDEVRLSAAGSVIYRPATPRFSLDGRPVDAGPIPLETGEYRAGVRLPGEGGVLTQGVTFRMAPFSRSVPFETEVLRLTNQARARGWNCAALREGGQSLPPLKRHPELEVAALAQSAGMALHGYFDHRSTLDGSTPATRVQATGLRVGASAENIAGGQTTPQAVVDAWLRSPGHCRNIMGDFTHLGVAHVERPGTRYRHFWTQVFGTPLVE
ncbi:CAP domain-containing protein [Deinococcus sp. SDU3-2]|uniref:CAP domain-containing protein n=1 Tax=Deinococcus terrestris TaxID=2651870 RepID=A0A7X1TR87_9DEIO|nr:CAP domain-containing protein [Deinococcus terrestris]MPY66144.1 CAP domain-containing protein [Deinococcus terrestris]